MHQLTEEIMVATAEGIRISAVDLCFDDEVNRRLLGRVTFIEIKYSHSSSSFLA